MLWVTYLEDKQFSKTERVKSISVSSTGLIVETEDGALIDKSIIVGFDGDQGLAGKMNRMIPAEQILDMMDDIATDDQKEAVAMLRKLAEGDIDGLLDMLDE